VPIIIIKKLEFQAIVMAVLWYFGALVLPPRNDGRIELQNILLSLCGSVSGCNIVPGLFKHFNYTPNLCGIN